jgi:hypothetical protein
MLSASPTKSFSPADIDPARGKEGVGHPAADDQMIDLADQIAEHGELGRNLGTADNRRDWPLGIAERLFERGQLRFHRPAGEGRKQMHYPFGGCMGAM